MLTVLKRFSVVLGLLILVSPLAAVAGECDASTMVGNFEVTFEGAVFDGVSTEFTYCITGVAADDFRALSNWALALDPACIFPDDIASCSTDDCYYQVDDPNLGITGIKFDEVEIEAGETVCYSFSLDGDWENLIGSVEIGTKAGRNVSLGEICGPICRACGAALSVSVAGDGTPRVNVRVRHNRPPTVLTPVYYTVSRSSGERVHSWSDGPVTLDLGGTYRFNGAIPGLPSLEAGEYRLVMRLRGMSGWITRSASFTSGTPGAIWASPLPRT